MHDILHTVYLKHDTSFKSLNKRALAQIVLKFVFLTGDKGILIQNLRTQINEAISVKFDTDDILEALTHLKNTDKINIKSGKSYIKESYKSVIKSAITESDELHDSVITRWFSKSESYQQPNGVKLIRSWFECLLINFFKEYSYDWMNDLKSRNPSDKKRSPNLDTLIDLSFLDFDIEANDFAWLKDQFIKFMESEVKDDNDLLWIYGSSMFSSTLLTVRNFADDLSIDVFKDATFILDTNILMILELEGFDKSYAIQEIANAFQNLGIETNYFYVSREEYQRAIQAKRDAILITIDNFDFNLISEVECPFMKTAIKRGCKTLKDFEDFFDNIMDVPKTFGESFPIVLIDHPELNNAIIKGENNDGIKERIDKIYQSRTSNHKRERPKQHDAGIIEGAKYLNKSKKTMILTRDSILREYAFETSLREESPIAIGLDSLIQMLAINYGGTDRSSVNFAPLFSKLVSGSLMPEKGTFRIEDLSFIMNTHIQIRSLSLDQIKSIANKVNKMRLKGVDDDDVVLEIQRSFQSGINSIAKDVDILAADKRQLELENRRASNINSSLEKEIYRNQFKTILKKQRKIVAWNWLKLVFLFVFIAFCTYFTIRLTYNPGKSIDDKTVQLIISVLVGIGITYLANLFSFKGKLWISKVDKEKIDKDTQIYILGLKQNNEH